MATFPAITPTYGAQKTSRPNTRMVKFGDGYEHRTVFGLPTHANPKQWSLTWNVSEPTPTPSKRFLTLGQQIQPALIGPRLTKRLLTSGFVRSGVSRFRI